MVMIKIIKVIQSIRFLRICVLFLTISANCGFISVTYAQWTTQKEPQESKTALNNIIQPSAVYAPALEGPIDPQKYFVGPSDIFAINIWSSPALNLAITVTPEGTLIIPTVGEIYVADLSLADVKTKIIAEIKKKYLIGNPSVTLLNPRTFIVTITGNVRFPGRYIMNATERVDRLIQTANSLMQKVPDKFGNDISKAEENPSYKATTSSKRNILIRRRNGKVARVDIQKFFATKNEQWNPFLCEGDEVFVSRSDTMKNLFAVYGAVNLPGRFELVEGDNLLDGVNLAYGFSKSADLDSIEHIRFDLVTGSLLSKNIKAANLFPGSPDNLPLEPGDRIIVKEKVDLREDCRVFIEGEVLYPGIYPITKNNTKITEVIQHAGGLTEYASIKSMELLRKTVVVDDAQFDRMIKQKSNITPEDNTYVTVEGDTKIRRDNVNVDFERLFSAKDESQDIILQSEDRIIIPSIRKTVYVFGQVVSPGNIAYIEGKDVEYYIDRAGGFNDDAQKGDVAVIKWTTREWFDPDDTQIQEGDFIWVPPVIRRPASYWLAIIGQTASIISVALSIVILVIQLNK